MKKVTILLCALLLSLTAAGTALAWGGAPAQVRVLHASPDAPAVNVLIDGRVMFPHVGFGQTTHYVRLEPGDYNVKVVTADRDQLVLIDTSLTVEEGQSYTVAAVGLLAAIEPLVLTDSADSPDWGQAKIRVVHASPNAPAVDVVTSQGDTLFTAVPFKGVTEFLGMERGLYHVQLKPAGGGDVVLDIPWLPLQPGAVQTVVVLGLVNDNPALSYTVLASPRISAGWPCNPCWQPPRPAPCCGNNYQPPHPPAYYPWPYHPQTYPNPQFGELQYRYYYQMPYYDTW